MVDPRNSVAVEEISVGQLDSVLRDCLLMQQTVCGCSEVFADPVNSLYSSSSSFILLYSELLMVVEPTCML